MPLKRSKFSAFSRRRSHRPSPIPLVNMKATSPTASLYTSVAMIGQILENLQKLLDGPMAAPCPEFLRSYVMLASKNLSDLMRQLSNKLNTTHQLDPVAVAAVELLDSLAEYDEDAATGLAEVLSSYAEQHGSNSILQKILGENKIKATLHDPLLETVDEGLHIAGVLEIRGENVTAEVEFNEVLPLQAFDHVLRNVKQ